ncbi:sensor histidine kinase [Sporolactobacillus vineae]|uniref:sensor histidine kinase n=1 Tax=Sporolactobacillus vineae TaxID=444463 RepID=UPI0002893DC0|nr:sensor histidine kinase [Sporolactobacillus vineae]
MSGIKRQIISGILFSLCFLIIFSTLYFLVFPPGNWELIWTRQVWHLPFALIVPALAACFGLASGFLSGFYWRSTLNRIDDALADLTQGRRQDLSLLLKSDDTKMIGNKLQELERQVEEQAQLSRKMASRKSEIEEKVIQNVVSEERNRLARELHDSVSQQLFAASMLMSTINESQLPANDAQTRQLHLVEETIHQSQLEMRALFLHLRPVQLHGKALKEGMEDLLGELRQKVPMTINWTIEPIRLEKGMEDQLFRILQESVSNTLRHAKASTLDVLLIRRDGLAIMRISDDGIGFRRDQDKPGSYGLMNIRERAAQIGGQLRLVSVPGQGTSLEIKVPILKGEELE